MSTYRLMTFEEFERLPDPEDGHKLELLDGELIRYAACLHSAHEDREAVFPDSPSALLKLLHKTAQARDLGEVFTETGYRLGQSWLIPDVSVTHAGQAESNYLRVLRR